MPVTGAADTGSPDASTLPLIALIGAGAFALWKRQQR
jgi:hypothetical protein